jgi:hypothetical protein
MIKILLILLSRTPGSVDVSAKRWHSLSRIHSTKLDAARAAKECGAPNSTGCYFEFENSQVTIILSGGNLRDHAECPNLPAGTVLAVAVEFNSPQPLKNFRLKNQKVVFFDPSSPPNRGYKGYYYPEEGFIISAFEGRVVEVVYVAEQKDIHRCPEYYADPKAFVEVGIYP